MEPKPSLAHFENAASRVMQNYLDACDARDAATVRALVSARYEAIDKRRDVSAGIDAPVGTVSFLDDSEHPVPLVATRGNRLALVRTTAPKPEGENERLVVVEIDAEGALATTLSFDLGDLDLAMAELDVRFTSGEAAAHATVWNAVRRGRQAIRRQDWETVVALTTEAARVYDHRPVRSRAEYTVKESIEDFRAIYAMSPNAKVLVRHVVGICDRGVLMVGEWRGTLDSGVFELFTATVLEVGEHGKIVRTDHHDLDQIDAARARYAELLQS